MTNDTELDEQAAERAEHVRAKRTERADPEDRVKRLADQRRPVNDLDLPEISNGAEVEDGAETEDGKASGEKDAEGRASSEKDAEDRASSEEKGEVFSLDDLPPELYEDVEDVRKKVTYGLREEFGVEIGPEEHFWPLVVHLGVEKLRTMWLEEVVDTYETVDELETPEES